MFLDESVEGATILPPMDRSRTVTQRFADFERCTHVQLMPLKILKSDRSPAVNTRPHSLCSCIREQQHKAAHLPVCHVPALELEKGNFHRMTIMRQTQTAINLHFATGVLPDFDCTGARASNFACVAFLWVRPLRQATSPILSWSVADQSPFPLFG